MKANLSGITLMVLFSAGIFSLFPSCSKLKEAAQIKVNYLLPDRLFTVDSLSHLKTEQVLFSQTFNANIDSIATANSGSIKNASFYQLQLSIVSPASVTFSWLTSARITITPAGGAPIEVATTTSINSTARSVDFVVKNLDVASNINGPFVMTIYGNLNGNLPVSSILMNLGSGIQVTISPL